MCHGVPVARTSLSLRRELMMPPMVQVLNSHRGLCVEQVLLLCCVGWVAAVQAVVSSASFSYQGGKSGELRWITVTVATKSLISAGNESNRQGRP